MELKLDVSRIAPGLFQGSAPPTGSALRAAGFDVLVLCAREIQLPASRFPGVRVIHAPMDDDVSIPEEPAHRTARAVARHMMQDRRVLTTCAMGLNRSGLISALALWYVYGWPGSMCLAYVQRRRSGALFNRSFAAYLADLPPRGTSARESKSKVPSESLGLSVLY